MKAIIKRELINYWKNPIFYLGTLVVLIGMYQILAPYLNLHKWENDGQISAAEVENTADAEIMYGYIPMSWEEQVDAGLQKVWDDVTVYWEMSEEEATQLVEDAREHASTEAELCQYLEDKYNYPYRSAYYALEESALKQGSAEEVNAYLDQEFAETRYSWYFARKFADFGGLFIVILSAVLMAFLFLQDTRRDTYELLHTKPVSAGGYVLGKIAGGFLVLLQIVVLMTLIFTFLCIRQGRAQGFPVLVWDLGIAAVMYILPNLFMVTAIYAGTALLFKNPLPALPALFLYIVYSNMGSRNAQGIYDYYGQPLAIMVRFPGRFLDTSATPYVMLNQMVLILAAAIVTVLCIQLWKRRRFY